MSISLVNINKSFDDFTALNHIRLELKSGKLTALLGPSGSGKTTLLRIIAGLEHADQGQIFFSGNDVSSAKVKDRNIGFVFQNYALFKHLNVAANIAFGLKLRHLSKIKIQERVEELLNLVQLPGLGSRLPDELSGGQKQRVALARALAVNPKILLLDEPFGALDAKVRADLRAQLRALNDKMHLTSVFVTHDQAEAMEVADEIVILNQGNIEQQGSPLEVYENPANLFVYEFLGKGSKLPASIAHDQIRLDAAGQDTAYARPHEIRIYAEKNASRLPAVVTSLRSLGAHMMVNLKLQAPFAAEVEAEIESAEVQHLNLEPRRLVYLGFNKLRAFKDGKVITCINGARKLQLAA